MPAPARIALLFLRICLLFSILTFGIAYYESRVWIKETLRDEGGTTALLISQSILVQEIDGFLAGDKHTPDILLSGTKSGSFVQIKRI